MHIKQGMEEQQPAGRGSSLVTHAARLHLRLGVGTQP